VGAGGADIGLGLRLARDCQHPDAQWLASLFRDGDAVIRPYFCGVMRKQGDDPRALFFLDVRHLTRRG
jgi:hypothetical protein